MLKYNGQSLGALRDYYEQLKNSGPQRSDSVEAIKNKIMAQNQKMKIPTTGGKWREETDSEYNSRISGLLAASQSDIDEHFKAAQKAHAEASSKAHSEYFKARKAITNAYIENGDNLDRDSIVKKDAQGNIIQEIEGFHDAFSGAYRDEIVESNINKMETLNSSYSMGKPVNRSDIGKSIQSADDRRTEIRGSDEYGRAQLIQQQAAKEKK